MGKRGSLAVSIVLAAAIEGLGALPESWGAARKVHTVALGAVKRVAYSQAGDPAGAVAGEDSLKIRALVVDGILKEWTTGDAHDVTDRSFVVRRAIRLNDSLPSEKPSHGEREWVWQRGPWLMVDRVTGHLIALKLPDYDPGISQVSWFRDYGAYCGVTSSAKSLYAVVAQLAARKPVLAKKLASLSPRPESGERSEPVCGPPEWQREPLRVTFHAAGAEAASFDIAPGSAVLVEETADEAESAAAEAKPK